MYTVSRSGRARDQCNYSTNGLIQGQIFIASLAVQNHHLHVCQPARKTVFSTRHSRVWRKALYRLFSVEVACKRWGPPHLALHEDGRRMRHLASEPYRQVLDGPTSCKYSSVPDTCDEPQMTSTEPSRPSESDNTTRSCPEWLHLLQAPSVA